MINAKKIEEIAKQVSESIPPGLKSMANEFEDKAKTILQSKLSQLDVVTREEFDVQTQVLIKTRSKLSDFETKLAELEAKIAHNETNSVNSDASSVNNGNNSVNNDISKD